MKLIFAILLLALACQDNHVSKSNSDCSIQAVVRKLSLDGCDWVFQLNDGKYLIPERRTYIHAPEKSEDPIYYYTFVDGAKVKINYQSTNLVGACMAGDIVFVTCITDLPPQD